MAAWGRFERSSGQAKKNLLSYKTRTFDALRVYYEAVSDLDGKAITTSAGSGAAIATIRAVLFDRLAFQHDQLLEDLEGDGEDIFADIDDELTARGIDVDSVCGNQKRPNEIAAALAVDVFVKGLVFNSSFCRDRIVRLLNLVGRYPSTATLVQNRLAEVPTWIFLQHAAQFMGALDKPEGNIVADILERVAVDYPNAIYFPFKITSEFLGSKGKALSQQLERMLLQNKSLECFVEALGGLTHPELRFKDGMKALQERYVAFKDSKDCAKVVTECYLALRKSSVETSWPAVQSKIGSYNKKKAAEIKTIIDGIAGPNGEKLKSSLLPTLQGLVEAIGKIMGGMKFTVGKAPVSEFSTWLSDFDSTEHRLEIPGQYLTYKDRPPAVERHEMLTAVDPFLRLISSIRKPKRIGLLGSGGGEYLFLVKGGEDLRNDERIELIFSLMNSIVEKKMACDQTSVLPKEGGNEVARSHGLRARTYAVIPMSSKIGILEWVSNTVPIQAIISEEMAKDAEFCAKNPSLKGNTAQSIELSKLEAFKSRAAWVGEANGADCYHKMFAKATKEQAEAVFASITATIPTDFLRRRLISMSSNPETFLTLRAEFAKTLAISSLFGYILGLG